MESKKCYLQIHVVSYHKSRLDRGYDAKNEYAERRVRTRNRRLVRLGVPPPQNWSAGHLLCNLGVIQGFIQCFACFACLSSFPHVTPRSRSRLTTQKPQLNFRVILVSPRVSALKTC